MGAQSEKLERNSLSNLQKELVWVLIKARILKTEFV